MKLHFQKKHSDGQKPEFPCPICSKILSSKYILEAHVSRHTGEILYHYCDKCEFKTVQIAALNNHRNVKHLGLKTVARPKNVKCDKCDLSFPCKANLANHMVVHSDEKPFICNFPGCEFRSKYIVSLKQHKERHSSKRKFACPMCNKRFKTNYEMDRHIVRVHTAEKTVKCDLCPHVTSLRSNLGRHRLEKHMNDGENGSGTLNEPTAAAGDDEVSDGDDSSRSNDDRQRKLKLEGYYYCEYPGCTFKTKSKPYIDKHGLRVHTRQRLHSCSICSKRFFDEPSVIGHMRSHTGERPFRCPFCSYAASLHPNIMRHVKARHGDKLKNCKSLAKLTRSGQRSLGDDLPSSLNPSVLLERSLFQFVEEDRPQLRGMHRHIMLNACFFIFSFDLNVLLNVNK